MRALDKERTGGGPPELDDILNEFAPLPGGESPKEGAPAKAPEEAPRERPEGERPPEAPAGKKAEPEPDPIFDTPPVEELEEPTLRLINRDGQLVRAVPIGGGETGKKRPEKRPAPPEDRPAARRRPEDRARPAPAPEKPAPKAEKPVPKEAKAPPEPEKKTPWWKRQGEPVHVDEKIIQMPEEDLSVTGRIGKLIQKADAYAEQMFPDDDGPDPEEALRERLLPGVDYEDDPTHAPRPRKRSRRQPRQDVAPGKLAKRYGRGLKFLHARTVLAFLWCLPQLYLMAAPGLRLPLPGVIAEHMTWQYQLAAAALGVSVLLGLDVIGRGLLSLLRLRLESETVLLFAVAASIADALTMPFFGDRGGSAPYCGILSLAVFFALWGRFLKKGALRQSCRVAASAGEPYLVTLDEQKWNGEDAYTKRSGEVTGFGSQIQEPDGVQRAYHVAAPLIILLSALLALVASVGMGRPGLFLWALSALLTAGCGFTAFLTYTMPYAAITRRLAGIGGTLGGWDGLRYSKHGVGGVLTDGDLFPPGSVTLNGIKLVGDTSLETLASYAATLVKETGSGMEKPFTDLVRAQGGILRKCSGVVCHEGGVTGVINGRQVYVGSGAFMTLMKIDLPQGLNVKNAAFCAVDGQLEGIFALNYRLHTSVRYSLDAMISNGVDPIMATRDFCVIPDMLRRKFKLPVDRMEYPSLDRRRELSSLRQEHAPELAAVLYREGLGPYAEAVVGGRRLVRSVRRGLFFDLLGAGVGMALAFYFTASNAFAALSAETMLVFLLLWMVPAALISSWANRY